MITGHCKGKAEIMYDDSPANCYVVFYGHESNRTDQRFWTFKEALDFAKKQESQTFITIFPSRYMP